MVSESELREIRKFMRRDVPREELFSFSFILCDNEVDRDNERFTTEALEEICEMFVGVTGVFDHDISARNQASRIFKTELKRDAKRLTSLGEEYTYVEASAYMVLTDETKVLAREIDAGIKKEVSLSCSAKRGLCSICHKENCSHIGGMSYDGKLCFREISQICDAYEWSFVAVPAQIKAGVIKGFSLEKEKQKIKNSFLESQRENAEKSLEEMASLAKIGKDYILRLKQRASNLLVYGEKLPFESASLKIALDQMDYQELLALNKALEKRNKSKAPLPMLFEKSKENGEESTLGGFII